MCAVVKTLSDQPITGLTLQDLADIPGNFRETTTEVLNQFKAGGLLELLRM